MGKKLTVDKATRGGVAKRGMVDRFYAELLGILDGQIVRVALVEHAIGEQGTGSDCN